MKKVKILTLMVLISTSAFLIAEGINNTIKRLNRMAYGYRDKEYFKLKIIQKCSFIGDSIPL